MADIALPLDWQRHIKVLPSGCHEWTGTTTRGYAYGWHPQEGRKVRIARHVLKRKLGRPLLPGKQALHTCNNPSCVLDTHLYEGTHRENHDQKVRDGRSPSGARNGRAKLTAAEVLTIREARTTGTTPTILAQQHNVNYSTIYRICAEKAWITKGVS